MSKVLKKTVRERKRHLKNLYRVVGSWRRLAREYYSGVSFQVLARFATEPEYVPTDEKLLMALDLITPPNPYRSLPRWYKRIPEALEYFNGKRAQIKDMSDKAKKQRMSWKV